MVQRADAVAARDSLRDVATLAQADLVEFWRSLDLADADATAAAMKVFMPGLVTEYGEVAAGVAADFYDTVRAATGVSSSFTAQMAAPAGDAQVQGAAGWAVGPLFADTPGERQAFDHLAGVTQRLVMQQARNTVGESTVADPEDVRYARMPGGDACAWCVLVASRGGVYWSESTAESSGHDFDSCVFVPVIDDDVLPYDVDLLYKRYDESRDRAESGGLPAILAQMRLDYGIA